MREIKFRQWSSDRFHYWGCNSDNFTSPLLNRLDIQSEQFTGLHDKNGKEIYDGDLVKVVIIWNELNRDIKREFISSIVFCEHRGCYIFPNHSNVSLDDARQDDEMISLEVIGNIHENPELLEGRE